MTMHEDVDTTLVYGNDAVSVDAALVAGNDDGVDAALVYGHDGDSVDAVLVDASVSA